MHITPELEAELNATDNKPKAMLSQPMAGISEEEIEATRDRSVAALENLGYSIVNTLFTDEWYSKEAMEKRGVVQIPLCFMAKSLENMANCHAAYFCKGWENARGCRIEHDAAKAYGLTIIYEETNLETTVDKVLDGIDAAKVRGRLIETLDNVINNPDFGVYNYDHDLNAIADELLKQFIITPRS